MSKYGISNKLDASATSSMILDQTISSAVILYQENNETKIDGQLALSETHQQEKPDDEKIQEVAVENSREKEGSFSWYIINNRNLVSYDGMCIADVAKHGRGKLSGRTLIRGIHPVPKYTQGFHLEMEVEYEGDANEFLIGFLREESKLKLTGLSGWYNDTFGYNLYNSNGSQFHHEHLEGKGIITEKLLSKDIVGCSLKRMCIDGKTIMLCYFTKNGIKWKKTLHLDDGEYFPLVGMCTPNVAIRLNLGETEFLSNFANYSIYEGDWIREFDGKSVNLRFCDDGTLTFKAKNWQHGQSINFLNVTNEGVNWKNEPAMKGLYQDGKIVWKNGQTWKRRGQLNQSGVGGKEGRIRQNTQRTTSDEGIEMESVLSTQIQTSFRKPSSTSIMIEEKTDYHISECQDAEDVNVETGCIGICWALVLAVGVMMIDVLLNLLLPTVDVVTDWIFFIGNIVSLHVVQNLDISRMKSQQELFIYACQKQEDVPCQESDACPSTMYFNASWYNDTLPYMPLDCKYFSSLVYLTAFPLTLNTLFTIIYWRRDNKKNETSRWTLLLAILGLYPQYKCLRYILKRDPVAKEEYLSGLGLLEPWMESTAQVLITSAIVAMPNANPIPALNQWTSGRYNLYEFNSSQFYKSTNFATFTWITSIVAMNIGLTKFVCKSPLKANKNVVLTLLLHTSFIFRVVATMNITKIYKLNDYWQLPLIFGLGLIPCVINMTNLLSTAGPANTFKVFKIYPQILLSPIFTPFLYTYKSKCKAEVETDSLDEVVESESTSTSKITCKYSQTDGSFGFHIWKIPSFINLIFLLVIPGSIQFRDDGRISYDSLIYLYATIFFLLMVGIIYFWGNICCRCIAKFQPDAFDPRNKTSSENKKFSQIDIL